jgi:thiol-disulfide isomerase/thioredoxin
MKRRGWIFGTAAVAALGAGAGVAWWQRGTAPLSTKPDGAAQAAKPEGAAQAAWGDALETPDGGKLALANYAGKPLLVNFWATWCPPCVREMPLLDRFAQEHRAGGWAVVGIAVDQMKPVREFLARQPVSYAIGVAGLDALTWVRSLGNVGGGLPFTVLMDASGAIVQRKIGELHAEELAGWVTAMR